MMRKMKKLTVTLQNKTEHTEHIDAVALGGADLVERLLELVAAQRRVVQEGLADLRERLQGHRPEDLLPRIPGHAGNCTRTTETANYHR